MIAADFLEKNLVEVNKIQKLKKSAIYKGDLGEHWPFSEKEAEWTERNLCRNTFSVWENILYNIHFLSIKFSRISWTGLHLCSFFSFFQMLIKYLKINVLHDEWTAYSRHFFRHAFTSLFIVKSERFYDYFSVTILFGKKPNFLVTLFLINKFKKTLQHRCFSAKFAKFLRTPFFYGKPPVAASGFTFGFDVTRFLHREKFFSPKVR